MTGISTRKRIWGWYFFDWASQPYHTLLVTFIFGPFFAVVASQYFLGLGVEEEAAKARAQVVWSQTMTITGLIIGLGAPFLGAMADISGRRTFWVTVFSAMYFVGAWCLWFTEPSGSNMWLMLFSFGLGFIGAEYALIFINSQLPSLGSKEEVGKISGSGFAFGYLGGVVSLIILLLFFAEQGNGKTLIGINPLFGLDPEKREGTRAVGPITALWFAVFMIPYFLWVRESAPTGDRGTFRSAISSVAQSIKALRNRGSLATYLGASMLYRDALNGLYSFGGVYAALVLGWGVTQIGVFGIIAAISAAVFSWFGGFADRRYGPKPVIVISILFLSFVCVLVVGMDRTQFFGMPLDDGSTLPDAIFFGCGVLIGGFGGILQSASRSMMVRHTNPDSPTESFGLYGLSGRATAFLAPALIGVATAATGSARLGVSPIVVLFALGLILLLWVKAEGDREQ